MNRGYLNGIASAFMQKSENECPSFESGYTNSLFPAERNHLIFNESEYLCQVLKIVPYV